MRPVAEDNDCAAAGGRCQQRMFVIKSPTNLELPSNDGVGLDLQYISIAKQCSSSL